MTARIGTIHAARTEDPSLSHSATAPLQPRRGGPPRSAPRWRRIAHAPLPASRRLAPAAACRFRADCTVRQPRARGRAGPPGPGPARPPPPPGRASRDSVQERECPLRRANAKYRGAAREARPWARTPPCLAIPGRGHPSRARARECRTAAGDAAAGPRQPGVRNDPGHMIPRSSMIRHRTGRSPAPSSDPGRTGRWQAAFKF